MITGSLNTLQRTPLPAPLAHIMAEVVKSVAHWGDAPLGKTEIDGLNLFCLVSEDLTEPAADRRGEFHQQYLDIQLLLRGEEWIGVGPHDYVSDGADHPHPDLWFVDDEQTSYLALQPGDFAIFWPGELHRPLCTFNQPAKVKKLVVKVRKDLLAIA
ncbi:YhcH/YjgK/YiaL family protein [Aeromonas veronii]|uniref:YhcH/YjgK/YiaL family protein n=1 Tax=Aeromonas veronii TaxID=654 RepID=A0AAW5M4X4_AERVE|nr:YhcH/YjgK/YiaL family protein [Aeromonas veronii]ELV7508916.1 YhcH/YjgK/YiaL family protein [Aeromonas veronii]MCR4448314.1 YhcH/YjgK/YiaL family protein [Aeromonas veronii]MCR6552925.1 YhcH/YjgK/YiaL family protein [Aeromonas sp. CPF2-S1]